jgi:hypothetical protein
MIHRGPIRKAKPCLAEVVRFASNPPPRRIANYPESKFYLNSSLLTNYFETYRALRNRIYHRGPLRAGVAAPHPKK